MGTVKIKALALCAPNRTDAKKYIEVPYAIAPIDRSIMFSQNIPSNVNMIMIGLCIAIGKLMILDNKKHQKLNGMNEIVPFEKDVFKVTTAHDNDANKKKRFPL